jgi:hypothetical protein
MPRITPISIALVLDPFYLKEEAVYMEAIGDRTSPVHEAGVATGSAVEAAEGSEAAVTEEMSPLRLTEALPEEGSSETTAFTTSTVALTKLRNSNPKKIFKKPKKIKK